MDKKIYNVKIILITTVLADSPEKAKEIAIKNQKEFVPLSQVLETKVNVEVEEEKNGCKFAIDLQDYLKD
jgi:hypothetical protein